MRNIYLVLVIGLVSLHECYAQGAQQVKLKRSDLEHDVHLGDKRAIFPAPTDFRVLDGMLLVKEVLNPINAEWANTIQIKDRDELERLGASYPDKSYTFFNSEVSDFYKSIYQRALVPLAIRGMNLPVIIDGYLFAAAEYSKTSHKSTAIRSVKFIPKGSLILRKYPAAELGALEIDY